MSADNLLDNRVVIGRVDQIDGWTELTLKCGHVVYCMTAVGESQSVPCSECVSIYLKGQKTAVVPPQSLVYHGQDYLCAECHRRFLAGETVWFHGNGRGELTHPYDVLCGDCEAKK